MNDRKGLMELEILNLKKQSDKEAHVTFTPIEQEIEQDRETWIEKANRDKKMLWHMAYHYMTYKKNL